MMANATEKDLVSVVIPAYNAEKTIGRQLVALRTQVDPPPFEVIIADNRSQDDTAGRALSMAHDLDLRVVSANRRQGANCARNTGVAASRGRIIVFVDADDELEQGALRALVDRINSMPDAGIVGGMPFGQDVQEASRLVQNHLPAVISALMAVQRECYDAVGGFDEDFVGGHEEVDFCWRAQYAGWCLGYAPEARFDYTPRKTSRGVFRQYYRYGYTYIQLFAKHRREHRLVGSTAKTEIKVLQNVISGARSLARGRQARWEYARGLGWVIGRWRGDLAFRTWGPK